MINMYDMLWSAMSAVGGGDSWQFSQDMLQCSSKFFPLVLNRKYWENVYENKLSVKGTKLLIQARLGGSMIRLEKVLQAAIVKGVK